MDAAGDPQAVQLCRVQSEDVKNESKGLQETGLPAINRPVAQYIGPSVGVER